ncbi:MAG: DNA polymerase IV [Sulfurimonadaceae bacterium]
MKIHIDLDCFFVSAERTIDPSLKGKPVGIGGRGDTKIFSHQKSRQFLNLKNSGAFVPAYFFEHQSSKQNDLNKFIDPDGRIRGMLTTTSYEARAYGVKTGCTIREALQLCPEIIIKQPNMRLYQELSYKLKIFLQERIPVMEQGSIDEFYGDLDGWVDDKDVPQFVDDLKNEAMEVLELPLSVGAAYSKFTAKMATNVAKPFGTRVIYPHEVDDFIKEKPLSDFPGIGRQTEAKLLARGLTTLGEIQSHPHLFLHSTKSQKDLYQRVCGIDKTPLQQERERKSIGISRTFDPEIDRKELRRRVIILSRHLSHALVRMKKHPTHYSLSIRYDMNQKSHTTVTINRLFSEEFLRTTLLELFQKADIYTNLKAIRIGLSCSAFTQSNHHTFSLLEYEEDTKRHRLTQSTSSLREKYGLDTLQWGGEL